MTEPGNYFFCGLGGSGMLPLATIIAARGDKVAGSDRSYDQGRTPDKFAWLKSQGITIFPQDGTGLTESEQVLVTSGAVEDTVPDVKAADHVGAARVTRAQLLAGLFNEAEVSIGVAGTSGKSTTTGMLSWILHEAARKEGGKHPTVMNGAVMNNFTGDDSPFASALAGDADLFVSEVDESDGSISLFEPTIAVLNNIAVDHLGLRELRSLFKAYIAKSDIAILNLDNEETKIIAGTLPTGRKVTYSLTNPSADLYGKKIEPGADGISFDMVEMRLGTSQRVCLQVPGAHNISNALAAIAAATAAGVSLDLAAEAICTFTGIRRRLETIGTRKGITVIDDFAHNPDKIAASLKTLHAFPGRLVVFFQPHGFGPLAKMKDEFIETFAKGLGGEDCLVMCEPVYFGGTVERKVSARDIIEGISACGATAEVFETREDCGERLNKIKKSGDRVIIMGARDDTLSEFAREILKAK